MEYRTIRVYLGTAKLLKRIAAALDTSIAKLIKEWAEAKAKELNIR